jgi:hypothetical protein
LTEALPLHFHNKFDDLLLVGVDLVEDDCWHFSRMPELEILLEIVQQPLQRRQQRQQNYGLQLAAVVKFDVVGVVLFEGTNLQVTFEMDLTTIVAALKDVQAFVFVVVVLL